MNPELKRNLWLDSTLFRQLIMPATAMLFLYLAYVLNSHKLGTPMAITAILTFLVIMIFWGARSVSDSMMDEINQHTWDFQRMSAMGAWSMTWGKLAGSSFYPWLSASIPLCLYIASVWKLPGSFVLKTSVILITIATFSLGFSLLNTLFMLRKSSKSSSRQTNGINLVLGIYLLVVLYPLLNNFTDRSQEWYGTLFTFIDFTLFSSIAYTIWVIIAVYRLMRQELQYQNSPIIWLIFALFQIAYLAGFNYGENVNQTLVVVMVSLILSWLGLYFSDNQLTTLHRFTFALSKQDWQSAWHYTPLWLVSYAIYLCCSLYYIVSTALPSQQIFVLSCLFFVLRDIGIVLVFNISKRHGKTDSSAFIITLILYLLLPRLMEAMHAGDYVYIFLPSAITGYPDHQWTHIIPALTQAIIVWTLVTHHYRRQWQSTN